MARRGDETQTEPFDIVEGIVEGVDLEFAAVARTGIDFANGQRPAEALSRDAFERRAEPRSTPPGRHRRGFGQRTVQR